MAQVKCADAIGSAGLVGKHSAAVQARLRRAALREGGVLLVTLARQTLRRAQTMR
jgi:hypothetical protein